MQKWLFIFALLFGQITFAQLSINEVCAVNTTGITDNFSEFSDWIEIKNTGTNSIQLNQYYLQSTDESIPPWQLPSKTLNAGDLFLVFASKQDQFLNDTAHANFNLNRYNDAVFLLDNSLSVVDQLSWEELPSDVSIGKSVIDQSVKFYDNPTPDFINSTIEFLGVSPKPDFSKTSSFFSGSIRLELNSIHPIYFNYNLDTPSVSDFTYTTPISSDTTFSIAARCVEPNYIPSSVVYHSFIVGAAPEFPVVFVHTSPDNLFSEDHGIFVKGLNADTVFPYYGANYWADIQFPGYFHLLSPGQRTLFSGNIGIRPHGGTSARNKSQKPLRLIFKEDYGPNKLKSKLFTQKTADKFKRLVLRNSGGDFNKTHFRDGILHQIMLEDQLNLDLTGYTPSRAYINGENWGIYNIREKVGPHYLESNYEIHRDSLHLIEEGYEIIRGDSIEHYNLVQYAVNNDLNIPSNYNHINDQIDLKNFTDYFASEIILANADWPNNNLKLWKPFTGGKWKYILFDLDASLGLFSWLGPDYNMWDRFALQKVVVNKHIILFNELMENDEFHRYFVNRYADLANTTFSAKKYFEKVDEIEAHLSPQIYYQHVRWGSNEQKWKEDIDKSSKWMEDRETYHRQQIQDSLHLGNQYNLKLHVFPEEAGSIQLNTLYLQKFPWEGIYYNENSIDLSVTENSRFTFSHWLIHKDESVYTTKNLNIDFENDAEITAVFSTSHTIQNKLLIYPSPATFGEAFTVSFQQATKDKPLLTIYNLNGQLIYSEELKESQLGRKTHAIQTNQLAQGAYVINVTGENFSITNQLFVK